MKQIGFNIHPHGMPAGDVARLDRTVDEAGSAVCLFCAGGYSGMWEPFNALDV